jgi:hypothetical protein
MLRATSSAMMLCVLMEDSNSNSAKDGGVVLLCAVELEQTDTGSKPPTPVVY